VLVRLSSESECNWNALALSVIDDSDCLFPIHKARDLTVSESIIIWAQPALFQSTAQHKKHTGNWPRIHRGGPIFSKERVKN
jgi:hypothetical protein